MGSMQDLSQDSVVMETTASLFNFLFFLFLHLVALMHGQCAEWLQGVGNRISEGAWEGGGCLFWWLPGRLS